MRNRTRIGALVGAILLVSGLGLLNLRSRSLATKFAISSTGSTVFTREEAIKIATTQVGPGAKVRVIDARLLRHEDAAFALGSRPGYGQMIDYPYTPDTPTWAITLMAEAGVPIFDDNRTPGAIFLIVAGDSKVEYSAGLYDPSTDPSAIRLRELPDLDGQLEIVPIPIPTQGPLPPTATRIPIEK